MKISLGNLLENQEATIKITLIQQLEIVFGCFKFFLPVSFYPDYRNLGAKQNLNYNFKCVLSIESKLSYTSIPSNTSYKYIAKTKCSTITTNKPSRELIYYFKAAEDLTPKLVYGKLDRLAYHPNDAGKKQVALNISFLPTFETIAA